MTRDVLEKQLEKWSRLLLAYSGAALTLLVIAVVELPARQLAWQERALLIDGWYGVWFVLELACLVPGVMILLWPSWRRLPLGLRLATGCGYLACAWAALLAFDLRTALLDLPQAFHFLVFGLGAALAAGWLLARRRLGRGEEMFP